MELIFAAVLGISVWLLWKHRGQTSLPDAAAPPSSPPPTPIDYGAPMAAGDGLDQLQQIVQGVIHAESRGRQTDANGNTLTSSSGALGVMQLMPSTAAQFGVDPNDEQQNIAGGTAYLTQLFQKYGNWFDALAAYNWGPGNVDKAMGSGGSYPASVNAYASGILTSSAYQGD